MARLLWLAAIGLSLGCAASHVASAGCSCKPAPQAAPQSEPAPADSQATAQRQQNRRYSYSPSSNSTTGSNRDLQGSRSASQSGYGASFWRADRKIRGF